MRNSWPVKSLQKEKYGNFWLYGLMFLQDSHDGLQKRVGLFC